MKLAKIYYMKKAARRELSAGISYLIDHNETLLDKLSAGNLEGTHTLLAVYPVETIDRETMSGADIDLEEIFSYFQGECWSPNGEAKELIEALDLVHTSMSVGDIVVCDGKVFFCDNNGWEKLTTEPVTGLRSK